MLHEREDDSCTTDDIPEICIVCGVETGLCCSHHDEIVAVCANCSCPVCLDVEPLVVIKHS